MFYVYILESPSGKSWYTGYTSNLKRRISEHKSGSGSFTTSKQNDWTLIYYEAYKNKYDAIGREKFLKSGSGKKYIKKQLINYLNS